MDSPSVTTIISCTVGLAAFLSGGIGLLVRMKIEQSTMKVTVDNQGSDIGLLKSGQERVETKVDGIVTTLAEMKGFSAGKAAAKDSHPA